MAETITTSKLNIEQEKVILVALAKLLSEQSTYVIGELRPRPKMKFNDMIIAVDAFIKELEGSLCEENIEALSEITDALHEGMSKLRTDLINII